MACLFNSDGMLEGIVRLWLCRLSVLMFESAEISITRDKLMSLLTSLIRN